MCGVVGCVRSWGCRSFVPGMRAEFGARARMVARWRGQGCGCGSAGELRLGRELCCVGCVGCVGRGGIGVVRDRELVGAGRLFTGVV